MGFALLLLAMLGPAWFRGGNSPLALALFQLITALGFTALALGLRRRMPAALRVAVALWLAWLAWLLLQCLPLSPALLARWSPAALADHAAADSLGAPAWYSLSVMPGASIEGLVRSLFYFGLYLGLALALDSRARLRALLLLATATIGGHAVVAAANSLGGLALPVPGWNVSEQGIASGGFINRNHFAAYLVLGACLAIAAMLGQSQSTPAWASRSRRLGDFLVSPYLLLRVLLLAIVVGVVLSRSRMGNITLAIALSVYATAWALSTRRITSLLRAGLFFALIAAVDVALISERYGLEQVLERIEETDLNRETRPEALRLGVDIFHQYRWTGAGLGSYAALQERHKPDSDFPYYDHAHNDYVEFGIEVGGIGLALLGLMVGYHLLLALRSLGGRDPLHRACAAAALAGVSAAAVHALTEFNLQILGYVSVLLGLLAMLPRLSGGTLQVRRRPPASVAPPPASESSADSGRSRPRPAPAPAAAG